MKRNLIITFVFVLLLLVLSACASISNATSIPTSVPATPVTTTQAPAALREAQVQSVEIKTSNTEPMQYWAIVRGSLSESCATITDPQISVADNTIQIKVLTLSPTDRGCIQITTPFEQMLALNTANLSPGTYTVVVNGVSAVFTIEGAVSLTPTSLQLIVQTTDGTFQVAKLDIPLNPTAMPTFNNFLPYGGSAEGSAYVLDSNQGKAVVTNGNSFNDLVFVQSPTSYGLAVWPGDAKSQPRLAWATQNVGGDTSSTIKISSLDGTVFDTLLTQDATNPPSQLMAQFFSPDGEWLYFSKEPVGIGGYILFSGGSSLYKINVTTKEIVDVIPTDLSEEPVACLDSISADFRYVAEHCSQNIVRIRDLASGGSSIFNPPADITSGYQLAGSARFSPDGKKLAYALAKSNQEDEQGWVVVSDTSIDNSKVILTSQASSYYTIAGWLDDQTLLVQSTNPLDCSPFCKSELWTVKADGTEIQKVADGSFLAAVPNDAFIQLPAPTPIPVTTACMDAAEYIGDDGTDGSTYAPNTAFTKTWTVKNTGTCTWDSRYLVYQKSGAFMTQQPGYWLVPPDNTVEPGQTVDIHVGMTSPPTKGNYKSFWGLKNEAGEIMPIEGGADGNSFYVEVKVNDGAVETGAVTATAIDIVPEQGSGEACTSDSTYFVHAYISTDGPTTASYEIGSTAGQISAGYFDDNGVLSPFVRGALEFDQAETQKINLRFVGPYPIPDDLTVNLRVNDGEWINVKLYCP
jgi:hypothetical protein